MAPLENIMTYENDTEAHNIGEHPVQAMAETGNKDTCHPSTEYNVDLASRNDENMERDNSLGDSKHTDSSHSFADDEDFTEAKVRGRHRRCPSISRKDRIVTRSHARAHSSPHKTLNKCCHMEHPGYRKQATHPPQTLLSV
ncbi:UNVERIFIED_CONTAM: hypothetical protein Slati_3656000 [Sesamum latifolium]|uniref:Uncharacterized protein n=1 Tax=Sesamum latifolium TaxID=2727402 RepID=A0AAW2U1I0_9LAMI